MAVMVLIEVVHTLEVAAEVKIVLEELAQQLQQHPVIVELEAMEVQHFILP
jgi:hypothetical protein